MRKFEAFFEDKEVSKISPLIVSTLENSSRGVKLRRECVHGKIGKFRE